MNVSLDFLKDGLVGTTVPIPVSGTLSGHAAGEPFDKHAFKAIKDHFPKETYRQYEYLNQLYTANPSLKTVKERQELLKTPALRYLLSRGSAATDGWSESTPFEEKQNDTADILVVKDTFFNIIDVKTFNKAKNGQPPNIISAYKLAKMCALMLESKTFDSHDITYLGITWEIEGANLKCTSVDIKELFKTNPTSLYINWAAALQIQFHVANLSQDYGGGVREWCVEYLENFAKQAKTRSAKMEEKFVKPFLNLE